MEKTIFLFKRHPDRSPEDFARHYIGHHAPLGARLTRCLLGYTVNIVEQDDGPDAITEHWIPKAADLLTPSIAYASPEDFQAVFDDDRTLFSGFDLYVVVEEIERVVAAPSPFQTGVRTPETKRIIMYGAADTVPPPPDDARRVVDNRIGYRIAFSADGIEWVESDIAVVRMVWEPEANRIDVTGSAVRVGEYRFIAAPGRRDEHAL